MEAFRHAFKNFLFSPARALLHRLTAEVYNQGSSKA